MQAAGAHRLELRGIRLHREELHPLAGDLFHMLDEAVPDLGIDRGVFDRRVGEDQHRRIDELLRVLRRVGDHVAVGVGEALVQC